MSSIYEYPLQLVPRAGRRAPDFIMVHGVLPYNAFDDTHFGYAGPGGTGNGVVEFTSEAALDARLQQIHNLNPYQKDTSEDPENPVIVDLTTQEVSDMATDAWGKASSAVYAVVEPDDTVVDRDLTFYDLDYYWANVGINGDTRSVVTVQDSTPPTDDLFWTVDPINNAGTWTQQWAGRAFTSYELEGYKAKRKLEINAERKTTLEGGFSSATAGKPVDTDPISRQNMIGAAVAAIRGQVNNDPSYDVTWRAADDTSVTMPSTNIITMALEMLVFSETAYAASWARKDAVNSMTTRVEIDGA